MSALTATRPPTTTVHSSDSLRRAALKKDMSITQTYYLAHKARAKLGREAARPDHDLRLLVGHANLLDSLMFELADAEREQERWFNQSVRGAAPKQERRVQWADRIVEETEEEYDDDSASDSSDDDFEEDIEMTNTASPATIRPASTSRVAVDDDMEEDDLEEDYAQLELVRTPSHSNSPPELIEEHDSESSDDESMPPSPPQPILSIEASGKDVPEQEHDSLFEESIYMPTRNHAGLVSAISVY